MADIALDPLQLNPLDPRFWDNEDMLLYIILSEDILSIIQAGAINGVKLMPEALQLLIDFATINEYAIDYLRQYRLTTVPGINATTQAAAVDVIEQWIRDGGTMPELIDTFKRNKTFDAQRADAIATTEVTRLYAEGNLMSWRSTGVVGGKKWQTARDEKVCPICGPLHNKMVSIDGGYDLTADDIANSRGMRSMVQGENAAARRLSRANTLLKSLGSVTAPPAHVNCRCWLLPVVDLGLVEQQLNQFDMGAQFDTLAAELRGMPEVYVIND